MHASAAPTTIAEGCGPLARVLGVTVVVVAGLMALFFGFVVAGRIGYPYELEWMEGALVDHVARVLGGEPIYCPPDYDHVAFLYHPGYFYLAALVGLLTGPGYLCLRLVSVLATIGTAWCAYRIVRREGSRIAAIAAAGTYLASFSLCGAYFDVGRIDATFTFFLLAGIERLQVARTWRGLCVAAGLFVLAWLTKQTALVILPFVVLGLLPRGVGKTAGFGVGLAAVCGLLVWGLDALHDGWLWFFTVSLPSHHGVLPAFFAGYWTHDMLPLAAAFGLWIVAVVADHRSGARASLVFHSAWMLGCVIGSYLSRLHVGGAENVLMPAVAALAVATGRGLAAIERRGADRFLLPLGHLVVVAQLLLLFLLPFFGRRLPWPPPPAQRQAGDALLAELAAQNGPVFLPWHGDIAARAGKPRTAHMMAMMDVWRSGDDAVVEAMNARFRAQLQTAPFPRVYVDAPQPTLLNMLDGYTAVVDATGGSPSSSTSPPWAGFGQVVGTPGSRFVPKVVLERQR